MARVVGDGLKVRRGPQTREVADHSPDGVVQTRTPTRSSWWPGPWEKAAPPIPAPFPSSTPRMRKPCWWACSGTAAPPPTCAGTAGVSLEIIGPDDLVMGIQGTDAPRQRAHGHERRHGHLGDAGCQSQTRHLPGATGDPGAGLGAPLGQGPSFRAGRVRRTEGRGLDPWERGQGPFREAPTLSPKPPSPTPYNYRQPQALP